MGPDSIQEEDSLSGCDEGRTAVASGTGKHLKGAGEDFLYSLKIQAHLQEHLWEPILICSQIPFNIFGTADISPCEAVVNGCW